MRAAILLGKADAKYYTAMGLRRSLLLAMVAGAIGATGGAGLVGIVLSSGWYGSSPPVSRPVVPATKDNAVFEHWAMDDNSVWSEGAVVEPNCSWWNGSVVYTSDLCSHFSLSRMASSSAGRAIDRAMRCAAWYETECVISPEIGVSIPAAFVHDPDDASRMRMLIAPRIIPPTDASPAAVDATGDGVVKSEMRSIRVQDPEEKTNGRIAEFNHTIQIEYLPGGSRAPVSETLTGSDAYCVQLLRAAFVQECWQQLD